MHILKLLFFLVSAASIYLQNQSCSRGYSHVINPILVTPESLISYQGGKKKKEIQSKIQSATSKST